MRLVGVTGKNKESVHFAGTKPTLAEALRFSLRFGLISSGGPAGQIAIRHTVLVEQKRGIADVKFLHAVNHCMLLPGPAAQQLATYIGRLLHGTWGGLVAGVLLVLPSLHRTPD
ncbi:hypothetical protein GCM10011495_31290 [Hymenobacter frigidus]|uniref:Uncharacterized protein n=1 Tax=Hymenobacter frigidus TaxID=1524095 RepID=A0ABQ2AD48_9BACT|nr:hypothetical protein GCM10011495_31290 [Hymenobacter frigidus]